MRLSYFYMALLLWLFMASANANEPTSDICLSVDNPNELLNCILSTHPEIQIQEAQLDQDSKRVDVAKQRPNPGFGLEGVDNKNGGVSGEFALLHTFELGSKRDSRIKVANAQRNFSEAELLKAKENVVIQAVLNLHRIRQISTEIDIIEENLRTFRKVRKKYRQIGQLNPEQQISNSVFKLAEEDNKLKKEALLSEQESLLSTFQAYLGVNFKFSKGLLPKIKSKWPLVAVEELKGADVQKVKNEVAIANAKSELANSKAWPNLSIGPRAEFDTGQTNETRVGIALSIPLPFYNTNSGGRAKALMELKKSKLKQAWAKRTLERKVYYLLNDYKRTSTAVTNSLNSSNIRGRHDELHKLINRGIVSAPLIIELHREILEFYKSLHGQELRAVRGLWELYALRGTIMKESIE